MHTNSNGLVWNPRLRQWVTEDQQDRQEEMEWDGQKWVLPGSSEPAARTADGDTNAALKAAEAGSTEGDSEERFNPTDHNVAEVLAHLEAHPEDRTRVLRAEKRNKARAGILEHA